LKDRKIPSSLASEAISITDSLVPSFRVGIGVVVKVRIRVRARVRVRGWG
jgi:hypothetical protein